ncbi:MAG: Rossmann-like and DUF2520 domain-containing protein [Nonlabens sp.]|uniref:Rossmann-like and DUF2520 domain-containing protein n=1 Tax=Nonlabens sp. TaxID=1888209 RepID=UPI003EF84E58
MIEIIVIGTGNLGYHLCKAIENQKDALLNVDNSAFAKADNNNVKNTLKLVGYYNLSAREIPEFKAPLLYSIDELPKADLIIIATPDDFIKEVSDSIKNDAVVVHTSGSVAMDAVSRHKNHGVFYIPQSFSKSRAMVFDHLPICIEFNNTVTQHVLEDLGNTLSRKLTHLNSQQRGRLHIAAVYMNNFVNHCYTKADEILQESQIDASLLYPLMNETLAKAQDLSPLAAQTGPARRNDEQTIARHLNSLKTNDRAMYDAITQSIKNTYGN